VTAADGRTRSGLSGLLSNLARNHSYLLALGLLVLAVALNYAFQDNFFQQRVINGNLRVMLPLMILAAGQAIVIISGGIDLSVGAMVSLVNAVLVTLVTSDSGTAGLLLALLAGLGTGALAGAINGACVAFLRLQPIVTTYATSFLFSGLALAILPRPGGSLPRALTRFYRDTPLGIPTTLYAVVALLLVWALLRRTRFAQNLYAVGGDAEAARASGVPVTRIRFSSYLTLGLFSAVSALALTLSTGSGNARIGDGMTLPSIVAVVLGGTRLSGGQGGLVGAVIGVAILTIIRNLISFANVPTWYQTLVDALIILAALAGPGLVQLLRRRK
jgi:ribose transport system permease protein